MSKNDNLVSFNAMSKERHREISRLGGIASGKVRREKRELKQTIIQEGRVQNELARGAFKVLSEASSLLLESSHYCNCVWALEYSPTKHDFRIGKTASTAKRNLRLLSEGHKLDYVLIAVAATPESLEKMIPQR